MNNKLINLTQQDFLTINGGFVLFFTAAMFGFMIAHHQAVNNGTCA